MNKFTEKTLRNFASATPVGWTGDPESPDDGSIRAGKIITRLPVIFPDTAHVISSLQ
jgi:hypothetical protein